MNILFTHILFFTISYFSFFIFFLFKFEKYLGKLLSLSISTFVPTPLPNDRFFSYWRNTHDLMNAAARSVSLDVVIRSIGENEAEDVPTQQRSYWSQPPKKKTNTNIYTEADVKGLLRIDRAELGKIISTTTDDDKDDKNSDKDNDNKDNDKDKDNDNDNDTEKTSESESGEGDDSDGK